MAQGGLDSEEEEDPETEVEGSSNARKIGPKEFDALFYSLQIWRGIFESFDRDRSGFIDANELRDALLSLGYSVSPVVLELLVSKFDKSGGKKRAFEYENFIEYCLTVKAAVTLEKSKWVVSRKGNYGRDLLN
ncbi:calcium-binding protein CBP-like [Malus sylvestris]|uniref:calcium-binding protein CBP-like n=1 Tax=Malus sylvestris TaxID=3752 RepID=UPI0021ACE04E|nr:calcium-binding protein CBP-like [Malus sylvestris]